MALVHKPQIVIKHNFDFSATLRNVSSGVFLRPSQKSINMVSLGSCFPWTYRPREFILLFSYGGRHVFTSKGKGLNPRDVHLNGLPLHTTSREIAIFNALIMPPCLLEYSCRSDYQIFSYSADDTKFLSNRSHSLSNTTHHHAIPLPHPPGIHFRHNDLSEPRWKRWRRQTRHIQGNYIHNTESSQGDICLYGYCGGPTTNWRLSPTTNWRLSELTEYNHGFRSCTYAWG